MFQCTGDGKYLDTVEQVIYNTVLGSVSLDGERYFYVNPLEVWPDACEKNPSKRHVRLVRQEWYQVACCPQNTLRTLAGIREYIYYTKGDTLYVGLYVGGDAQIPVSDRNIALHVQTGYPFGNTVDIRIDSEGTFTLALRDPGWSKKTAVFLNGSRITDCVREKGMICIQRTWQKGDTVTLTLSVTGLRVTEEGWDEETLYRPFHVTEQKQELKAIPYCLWNNRGQGEMAVWIHSSGSEDS